MGYRFLRASFALLTTIYRLTTKGGQSGAAFPDLRFTLIKTRRTRKNTRKDADGWIQQSVTDVFYRESKPFSSRAQGLFIVSVNLFYREKKRKKQYFGDKQSGGRGIFAQLSKAVCTREAWPLAIWQTQLWKIWATSRLRRLKMGRGSIAGWSIGQ